MALEVYRVRINWAGMTGAPWVNTLFFDTDGGTAQQAATAAGTFIAALGGEIASAATWTTGGDIETLSILNGQPIASTSVTPQSGGGSGGANVVPLADQALVTWSTGQFYNGRQIKGRTFIPALAAGRMTAAGTLTTAVQGVINTAAAALISDTNSRFVVFARGHAAMAEVTGHTVWSQFAVLRSRRD